MDLTTAIGLVVGLLGAGGMAGGIVLLVKLRPEAGQIVVSAAHDALIIQTGVLDSLLEENKRLRTRVTSLERQVSELQAQLGHNPS